MIALKCKPKPPLDAFIDCFWLYSGFVAQHHRERALPTGTVELVFNLREDRTAVFRDDQDYEGLRLPGAVICGPHSGYFVLTTPQQNFVAGVHFLPGGASMFLGVPAGELVDRHVGLDDLWTASDARRLRDRLVEAAVPDRVFAALDRELRQVLVERLMPHPAVTYALGLLNSAPAVAHVRDVQERTGYGAKRFIELFRASVGLTPKLYCRVQRFQGAVQRLSSGRPVEWAQVALDCGYYDQPHLNREFRAFAGLTPGEYKPARPDSPNHVIIE